VKTAAWDFISAHAEWFSVGGYARCWKSSAPATTGGPPARKLEPHGSLRDSDIPHRLDDTIDLMATAAATGQEPAAAAAARAVIADCDAKLATHRAALEAGADPTLVTQWISETQARRARAEAELRTASKGPGARMSRDEIARLVRSISDLAAVIQQAEAEDKAEIYRQLGLRLTYVPAQATVRAEVTLDPNNDKSPRSTSNRGEMVRVRGGT
jgi:site-specific DNA recombinase